MKCPNCGYLGGMSDCGSADYPGAVLGLRCPECGECIPDDDDYRDDDYEEAHERDYFNDINKPLLGE